MIRTLEINNFQSWKNMSIELSEGVNVIKGRSHGGKSSIVRALMFGLLNDPSRGDYFVSWFATDKDITSVGIEFDDETYVIRKKGKGVNAYDLSTGELPTIGTDLPDEVKAITRMGPINIQEQKEQYYMLKETAGTVAKELNSLVGLDIIDQTLSKLNTLENTNSTELKIHTRDRDEIENSLGRLDFVDDLEKRVEHIEALWKEYQEVLKGKSDIIRLAEEIKEEDEFIKEISEWLVIKGPVEKLRGLIAESAEIKKSLENLNSLYSDITNTEIVKARAAQLGKSLIVKRDSIVNSAEYKKQFCLKCGAFIDYWRK